MSRLRCQIAISLDGFVAGPDQSEEHPIGVGGMGLHECVFGLAAWREPHGLEGGEANASSAVVEAALSNIGATIMGRNMFGVPAARGTRTPGTAGGATTRRSTPPSSSSPTTRASRSSSSECVETVDAPGVTHVTYRVTQA